MARQLAESDVRFVCQAEPYRLRRDVSVHGGMTRVGSILMRTRFLRPSPRILVLAQVLLRHLVDVLLGPVVGNLFHPPADYGHVELVIRIDHRERDPLISDGVLVLLAAIDGVDQNDVSLPVDPRLDDVG